MLDLKAALDMLMAADAKLKKQASEIADLLNQGTEEATQNALALQSKLDELQADYEAKQGLYDRLVKATAPSDVAKLFVPASPTSPEASDEAAKPKDVMTLAEYNNMPPRERLAFAQRGGKLEG
jgi:hypothetical protein